MLPIQFQINTGSSEPIYRQLMEQLRRRVAAGQWVAGQELPSVRELSAELTVHPMTISKAYSLLEAEGLLTRRRGVGMAVAEGNLAPQSPNDRMALLLPALEAAALQAQQLGIAAEDALAGFERRLRAHPPTDTSAP